MQTQVHTACSMHRHNFNMFREYTDDRKLIVVSSNQSITWVILNCCSFFPIMYWFILYQKDMGSNIWVFPTLQLAYIGSKNPCQVSEIKLITEEQYKVKPSAEWPLEQLSGLLPHVLLAGWRTETGRVQRSVCGGRTTQAQGIYSLIQNHVHNTQCTLTTRPSPTVHSWRNDADTAKALTSLTCASTSGNQYHVCIMQA